MEQFYDAHGIAVVETRRDVGGYAHGRPCYSELTKA